MIKGKSKRLLATLLGILMLIGMLPTSAFAASSEYATMTFAYAYQSDGSIIQYHGTFTSPSGVVSGGSGQNRCLIYANGQDAFCIQPGVHLLSGDVLQANASDTWNSLSADQQNAAKTVLAFGYAGNRANLGGNSDSQITATQMLVWEIVTGWRNPVTYERTNSAIYDTFCNSGYNSEVAQVYNQIVGYIQAYPIMPSFVDGKAHEMRYENGQYVLTLTDTNGVLADCSVSSDNSGISISKSGNTLTIISKNYISGDVGITVTKSSHISASAQLVAYGDPSLQDVLVGVAAPKSINAGFTVSTPGGTMKLVKTSEDGIVSGIKMTVTGNGFNKVVTTGADGTVSIEGLIPGSYTVTEAVANYYEPQEAKTVTIVSGETATVKFNNTLKRGSLSVSKTSEDGFTEGMRFRLFGISASGANVDLYATTDSTGVATFNDVLVAGVSGYTLEEVDTAIRYVIPEDQNVTVAWNEMTGSTVANILKKFNVTVYKSDVEAGTSQGDATLAGAIYGIYQDGSLVDTYTTDANGSFTIDYYVCGNTWTIKEIAPSEGYLVDEGEYHIGAEPENYEIELNQAPTINSYEQVIKGNVSIIKHSDDGSTQIETPEEGAVFEIYLASAGSYEVARESERDILICDADGFAQSKDLPYGQYTVHQTEGWEETEFMRDFTVFISENGKAYKYLINNAPYQAYIKVVKADAETGRTIPMAGAGFEIYDASGNKVSMSYTYPTLTTIDTFYVSEDGYLITPQKLDAGNYSLVEVQAPYGYVLNSDPVSFTVTSADNENLEGLCVIEVTAYDMAQKGTISITKSGEVFASVSITGEEGVLDKEGNWGIINPIYSAVYEVRSLSGATYQVIAAEDIYTGDGTLRVAAGTVVADMTTDSNGIATTGELYLGTYRVVETEAPYGFTLNEEEQLVELTYAGQEISITSSSASYVNDRQKLEISAVKEMEQDELYGIGMNGEITAVSFGLYAKEDIVAVDESVIPADGLLEIAFADENGSITFNSDLPFGSYYVKELTTDIHYNLSDTVYQFEFSYCGQDTAVQRAYLSSESIPNTIKYGRIEGLKVNDEVADGEERGMAGATFGIFLEGTMELTADNAITTVVSDENGEFAFEKVPYGDFIVMELEAPEGYVLSDARHFVSVSFDEQVIGLKVINYPIIGSVELTKVDKDYPDNHLTSAVFELYADVNANGELDTDVDTLIRELTEYEGGIYRAEGIRYGNYLVREKTAPEGFLLDENVYAFSITEDGQCQVIENEAGVGFADQVMMGKISICKTDKKTGDKLVGAGFRVCDPEGNTVAEAKTGEDGVVTFELRYGEYTVAEYEAPEGYVLDDTPYAFSITEDGQTLSVDMSNTKITGKLVISKVDADTQKLLPDAGFRIYAADGKTVLMEGRTDKKGVCEFELEFGKYFYQEFNAPDGYKLDDTKYEFSITEDGKVISVVMTNQAEEKKEDPKPTETPKADDPTPTTKPSTDGPKTGDDADISKWIGIAAVGLAAVCVGGYLLCAGGKDDEEKKKKK